jgi:TatD DNase family protein
MPVELIDTHCHLTLGELAGNVERVIADAATAGVTRLVTVACHPGEVETALALHAQHPNVFVSAGIHPHEAQKVDDAELAHIAAAWTSPGMVAIGEIGLDFHYDFSPRDVQRRVFERQLELAAPAGLPLIIHSRNAQPETVALLLKHGFGGKRVVFHCFSGTPDEAAELRSHGWWTSFTGIITFRKNAEPIRQALLDTPADQLMFETDAPYLTPEPFRNIRPNEPRYLVRTVEFAAELRGTDFETLARTSTANAMLFFRL